MLGTQSGRAAGKSVLLEVPSTTQNECVVLLATVSLTVWSKVSIGHVEFLILMVSLICFKS